MPEGIPSRIRCQGDLFRDGSCVETWAIWAKIERTAQNKREREEEPADKPIKQLNHRPINVT